VSGVDRSAHDIGDELYGLAPQEFTAARDGYVAEAKNAGNAALARELTAMKRPSVAAGLVNLVALRQPVAVSQVVELGETIRQAQGSVSPVQLRDLSAQRRKELDAAVALARKLATERGDAEPSRAVLTEVESTFAAAMADPDAARQVQAGRLLKALSYSGFGQAEGGFTAPAPTAAAAAPNVTRPARTAEDRQAAEAAEAEREAEREAEQARQRAVAEERVTQARRQVADATSAEADAEAWGQRLSDQIAELRSQLEVAQRDARSARQTRLAAERDLAAAERRLDRLG
jgi:hypothetical protein